MKAKKEENYTEKSWVRNSGPSNMKINVKIISDFD